MAAAQLCNTGLLPRAASISRVVRENDQTRTFVLDLAMPAVPGQFAMLWLPGLDEKPFSLMDDDPVTFTIAAVGPLSRQLHRMGAGERIWFRGPIGTGFTRSPTAGGHDLLVGGGYGAAPLLFLARRLLAGARTRVALGARTADELLLTDRFVAIAGEVRLTTVDGTAGARGLVTVAVEEMIRAERPDMVYACGPNGMLQAILDLCRLHSLPAQLSWEAHMRCAMGLCGSCEHEGMLLCADGPVLAYAPYPASDGSNDG